MSSTENTRKNSKKTTCTLNQQNAQPIVKNKEIFKTIRVHWNINILVQNEWLFLLLSGRLSHILEIVCIFLKSFFLYLAK